MIFIELNNGKKLNVLHISEISVEGNDIIYESAKGSLTEYREHFETEVEANAKYEELKSNLLI